MAHILLVSYSGHIKIPSALALDNGLANLAGALIQRGDSVLIRDLNTLEVLERMSEPAIQKQGAQIHAKMTHHGCTPEIVSEIQKLQQALDQKQESICDELFENLAKDIEKNKTQVVGFKCWGSDGIRTVKNWCKALREQFPHIKILLGGPVCEVFTQHTARYIENFDFMATGKAEASIAGILNHIENGAPIEKVPGVMYRAPSGAWVQTPGQPIENLDSLPWPVYDRSVYPSAWTGEKLNFIVLDESRGCPNRCHFCVHPSYNNTLRTKSVTRLVQEVEWIQKQLGTRYFRFAGSNTPGQFLLNFSTEILKRKIDMRFGCFLHVNNVKTEQLSTLYQAGLRCTFAGIESADDELLSTVGNKRFNREQTEAHLKALMDHHIFVTGSFIYPLPFETSRSRKNTLDFVRRVFGNSAHGSATFLNAAVLPQTEWWHHREKYGFEFNDDEYIDATLTYSPKHLYPPELQEILPYQLNGKTHREMASELSAFMQELVDDKVLFNVSDDVAIIASGCGMSPQEFRDKMLPAFAVGDITRIRQMVDTFNSISCSFPQTPIS